MDIRPDDRLVAVGTHGVHGVTHAAAERRYPGLNGSVLTRYIKVCTGRQSANGKPLADKDAAGASCSACCRALAQFVEHGEAALSEAGVGLVGGV